MKVNFYERHQPENQLDYIKDALLSENLISDGKYDRLLKEHFKTAQGIERILFLPSATAALELSIQLLGVKPGDEVIIPSFNFPSAANSVLRAGGVPVFCDIDFSTKNISIEDAETRITPKTRGIIPTHYAGISCDLDALQLLADRYGLWIVEDAAQGVESFYKGIPLGTMGEFGAFSFHHTKNFSCGEGGAFLFKDKAMLKKAEILRDNGTNKAEYMKKQISSYSWQAAGTSGLLSEACSAVLYSQMLSHREISAKREQVAKAYDVLLENARGIEGKCSRMEIPAYATPNHHIYYINCVNGKIRDLLKNELLLAGIDVRSHFNPLHLSDFGKKLGHKGSDLPESVRGAETLLRLPIHTEMNLHQVEQVVNALEKAGKKL